MNAIHIKILVMCTVKILNWLLVIYRTVLMKMHWSEFGCTA